MGLYAKKNYTVRKEVMRKSVSDLGVGAYLMMHGHKAIGRKGKNVFFELAESDLEEFDKLTMDYLRSHFNQFDSYLIALKKVMESIGALSGKPVSDLGISAFLMLHGYKVIGRKAKNIYFEVAEEDYKEFLRLQVEYLGGPLHQFDSYLMALKKVGEYMPDSE